MKFGCDHADLGFFSIVNDWCKLLGVTHELGEEPSSLRTIRLIQFPENLVKNYELHVTSF